MQTIAPEAVFLLEQWGRWARQRTGVSLGYPTQTPERRLRGGGLPSAMISDELALWVDQAVAQVQPRRARDAVVLRWACGASQRRLCRELRCRHTTAQRLLDDAHSQIAAALV